MLSLFNIDVFHLAQNVGGIFSAFQMGWLKKPSPVYENIVEWVELKQQRFIGD